MRALALGLLCAGCLSGPRPLDAPPAIGAWPPPGIEVSSATVTDFDRDGYDDLIIASKAEATKGVYVLLGSPDGIGASYHAFAAASLAPYAVDAADLDGDGERDLITVGESTERGLEVFPALTPVSFGDRWRLDDSDLSYTTERSFVRVLDLGGDAPTVFVADSHHALVLHPPAVGRQAFQDGKPVALHARSNAFTLPLDAFTASRAGGGHNLVAVDFYASAVSTGFPATSDGDVPHETANGIHTDPNDPLAGIGFRNATHCDLDGDEIDEVVGEAGTWYALKPWQSAADDGVARVYKYDQDPIFAVSADGLGVVCDQLIEDPDRRADLAALAVRPTGVRVLVLPDAYLTPPNVMSSNATVRCFPMPDTSAHVLVSGAFVVGADRVKKRRLAVVADNGAVTVIDDTQLISTCPL